MSLITEVVGQTPLVRLQRLNKKGKVFIKLESRNPGGSIKDRPALQMVNDLLSTGKMNMETTLIEPTSGNTGIGLCMVCASMGIKLVITMPDTMSVERRKLMKAYGATLVLTEGAAGIKGSVIKAEQIQKETPNSIIVGQFYNPSNAAAHEKTTGPEIVGQVKEYKLNPKFFLTGVGSGGSITGMGRIFKKELPDMKIVAVEPVESKILQGEQPKPHKIQGISPGFVAELVDKAVIDQYECVGKEEAYQTVRDLASKEGILVGISTGATVWAAIQLAEKYDCDVIAIAADTGERYLSVEGLFE